MKKSIILLEVIVSIALFSILLLGSMDMILTLNTKSKTKFYETYSSLKLEATRLFLINSNDISKLQFHDENLYFEEYLLLRNISTYQISITPNITTINICIDDDTICQEWKI